MAFAPGAVGVRDSKDAAPRLAFSPTAWHAFLGGVKER
ncbi:DUF397 domain-containing protein [Saccharothrix yanglingensis]|nr:DUF397 domain-containing protein [Saccharothrix yanglingensis]